MLDFFMAEKQGKRTVLPTRMEQNLLEHLATASGKKNHVQHVCPPKYSQRTNTNAREAASPLDNLFIPRYRKSSFRLVMISNVKTATCGTFEVSFDGMILQRRCQSMKLGSIPPWTKPRGTCPKLPSHQDASALSPFVAFCPRLLLWHRSARFTPLSFGHCNLFYIHPVFLLEAILCQVFHRGTKLILV